MALQCALGLCKFDETKQYAKKAYKLAPKSADGIKSYLLYLQHTGDMPKVERLARELLAVDKSVLTRIAAGGALQTIGRIPKAFASTAKPSPMFWQQILPPPPQPHQGGQVLMKNPKMRCLI